MLKNCIENVKVCWKFQGMLKNVENFKVYWQLCWKFQGVLKTMSKISRCVENHVKKFQDMFKTMLKISRCIENHVENFLNFGSILKSNRRLHFSEFTEFSEIVHIYLRIKMNQMNDYIKTYLSNVKATKFHVEDTSKPHSGKLVFHNTHSKYPRIPECRMWNVVFTVKVDKSKTTETEKSSKLWNIWEVDMYTHSTITTILPFWRTSVKFD